MWYTNKARITEEHSGHSLEKPAKWTFVIPTSAFPSWATFPDLPWWITLPDFKQHPHNKTDFTLGPQRHPWVFHHLDQCLAYWWAPDPTRPARPRAGIWTQIAWLEGPCLKPLDSPSIHILWLLSQDPRMSSRVQIVVEGGGGDAVRLQI